MTFHRTSEQDLNPRSCTVNDHPSVLTHEMMVIDPGDKPTYILTWKPPSFINHNQSRSHDDRFPIPLWETWFCQSLGQSAFKLNFDTYGDHIQTSNTRMDRV
jgi:hypothetical protein